MVEIQPSAQRTERDKVLTLFRILLSGSTAVNDKMHQTLVRELTDEQCAQVLPRLLSSITADEGAQGFLLGLLEPPEFRPLTKRELEELEAISLGIRSGQIQTAQWGSRPAQIG